MRAPDWGAGIEDLYAAAIEMCRVGRGSGRSWSPYCRSTTGPRTATCPSPLVLASAIAARTDTLRDHGRRGGAAVLRTRPPGRGHGGARHHQSWTGRVRTRHRPSTRGVRALRARDAPAAATRADEQLAHAARAASGWTGHLAGTVDADHTRTDERWAAALHRRREHRCGPPGRTLRPGSDRPVRGTRPGRRLRGGVPGGRARAGVRPDPGAGTRDGDVRRR